MDGKREGGRGDVGKRKVRSGTGERMRKWGEKEVRHRMDARILHGGGSVKDQGW